MREGPGTEYKKRSTIENNRFGAERFVIAGLISSITGLVSYVGLHGLGLTASIAVPITLILCAVVIKLLAQRLPKTLDGIYKRKPWLSTAWLLIALAALLQTTRISIFMLDPSQSQYSLFPWDKWLVEHCCLTAYSEGARMTEEGEENIYKPELYVGAEFVKGNGPHRKIEGFDVDVYHYPPPFLLLPLMVRAIAGGDFLVVRSIWFALSALTLMLAMLLLAYRFEPEGRLRLIGTAPLVWLSMPVMAGFQMSNVQILVISICIIAWAVFPRRAFGGGALLAMASVAKIFPGILFVYLVAQRKWKQACWTAGFAVLLIVLAFLIIGPLHFQMFIDYEMPRISSGEAFSLPFSRAFAVARNMAPFGIPLKLGWLGVPGMTLEVGRIVSMIYLLGVIGLAIRSSRHKPHSNVEAASIWISLLSLGSLVSPFSPVNYVLVSLILLVCLNREMFTIRTTIIIWLIICVPFFISRGAPFFIQALSFLPAQVLAIALPVLVLWRVGLKQTNEHLQGNNRMIFPTLHAEIKN